MQKQIKLLKNILNKEVKNMKKPKITPLSGAFMLISIVGFLISAFYVAPREATWGVTFLIFFATMFIASFVSMTKAPIEALEAQKR